jgi:CelD/BcsL family acetyltransferase involved in cellulose biosynthesis
MSLKLSARAIGSREELTQLEPSWWALWRISLTSNPFLSPAWCLAWLREFGRESEPACIAIEAGTELVGLAPFHVWKSPMGERILLFIGSGISDVHEILSAPGFEREVAMSVWEWISSSQSWDRAELEQLPEGSPFLESRPDRVSCIERRLSEGAPCPVLALEGVRSLQDAVRSSLADQVPYLRRRARRELGLELFDASEEDPCHAFRALFELHSRLWRERGLRGVLYEESVRRFHLDAGPALVEHGAASLLLLGSPARRIAGALYALHGRARTSYYLSGFDPELARLSPGTLLVGTAIESAIEKGDREFDFLRGREPYKYRWGARDRAHVRLEARRIG